VRDVQAQHLVQEVGRAPSQVGRRRVFTSNGSGEKGRTPPSTFEPRFLRRCLVVPCEKPDVAEIAQFLRRIWAQDGEDASAGLSPLAETCDGVRDPLTKLEVALCTGILPSPSRQPRPRPKTKGPPAKQEGESATSPQDSLNLSRGNGSFGR